MLNCRWARIILRMLYEAVFTSLILCFFAITFIKEQPGFFVIASLLLLFVLSFGIREWIPTHMLIFFLHLALMGVIYILPFHMGMRLLLMGIQVYLLISSLRYSYKGSVIQPIGDVPWPSFLTCCLIYILSIVSKVSALTTMAYIVTILLLILYYLMLYVEGLTKYMDSTRDVSGLPLKRMLHTNTSIVGVIILILLFGLFLGYVIGADGIRDGILAVCQTIIRYLFIVIGFLLSKLAEIFGIQDTEQGLADGEIVLPEEISGWGVIVEILLYIIFIMSMIFLFYGLLRKLIKLLLKPRSYEEDMIEAAEQGKPLVKEKSKGKIKLYGRLSLAEKARRYYKARIMKHKDELSLNNHSTCRDIENEINQMELDDVRELTELYAGIRYGSHEVDKTMLRRMKELAGK